MSWATVLKAGAKTSAKWIGKGAKATVETVGKTALHPQQTLKGAGTAVKTAVVGGSLGYVGWKKLTTDDSVVGIVSDALIGEKNTQAVSDTVHGAVQGVKDLKESVSGMTERVSCTMSDASEKMNGVSTFLGEMTSGNGGEMMGGFLNNVVHGNVSGLGIAGIVMSAFLIFGRFGWMGKLAGALLGMLTIGNNSRQTVRQAVSQHPALAQALPENMTVQTVAEQQEQIHRSRR